MYRRGLFVVVLACLLVVAIAGVAMAQQIAAPPTAGPGSRAIGMGGAFVAVADGPTAAAWNPANAGCNSGFSLPLGVSARAQNFDADEIQDLIDDIEDVSDTGGNLAAALAAADRVFAEGTAGGANIVLGATPYVDLASVGGIAAYATVDAAAQTKLISLGVTPSAGAGNVTATANAAALGNVGVSYSLDAGDGWRVGATLKQTEMRARRITYAYNYAAGGVPVGAPVRTDTGEVKDDSLGADLGFLYTPPEATGLSFGIVVRDVTGPNLAAGGVAMSVPRQIDVGLATQLADGLLVAADIHDLTGHRNGQATLHLGAEKALNKWLTARVGVYQLPAMYNDPFNLVGGIGVKLGPVCLNLATSTTAREFLSGELSLNF